MTDRQAQAAGDNRTNIAKPLPSQERLLELLEYNPHTGELFWRHRPGGGKIDQWNATYAGTQAFTKFQRGYYSGTLDKSTYKAHRIIYKMVHGEDPDLIDHINGDMSDNRIGNLRSVSQKEQSRNQPLHKSSASGVTGVSWCKTRKTWRATICRTIIGEYSTKEAAVEARRKAEKDWGFHPNHGRKNGKSYEYLIPSLVKALKKIAHTPVSEAEAAAIANSVLIDLPEDIRNG